MVNLTYIQKYRNKSKDTLQLYQVNSLKSTYDILRKRRRDSKQASTAPMQDKCGTVRV